MKKILLLILFVALLFSSQNLSFFFTVQFASYLSKEEAKKLFDSLPKEIKKDSFVTKYGDYFVFRYANEQSREKATLHLNKIKNIGFSDAFVVESASWRVEKAINWQVETKKKIKKQIVKKAKKTLVQAKKSLKHYKDIDPFVYNRLLYEADKKVAQKDYTGSIKGYEELLEYSEDKTFLLINLFYLYGKTKTWQKAKSYLEYAQNPRELLYAYGVGALESQDPNLLKELKPWLNGDFKGYLWLISAVFLEDNNKLQEAYLYYEEAYKRDRSDPFLIFAYARSCDIIQKYETAKQIYKQLAYNSEDIDKNLKDIAYRRLKELEMKK